MEDNLEQEGNQYWDLLLYTLRIASVFLVFGYASLYLWKRIISFALLPAQIVHSLTRHRLENQLKSFFKAHEGEVERIVVSASLNPKIKLDGVEIAGKDRVNKYIVYLNANGVCYEDILEEVYEYARTLNCKAIVFNYRGVGNSTGWPTCSHDLVEDALIVLSWLQNERHVGISDILLHGHSIGGSAAILALAELEDHAPIVADRAFNNLVDVVASICRSKGMIDTSLIGSIVTSYIFTTSAIVYRFGFENACIHAPVDFVSESCLLSSLFVIMLVFHYFIADPYWPVRPAADWSEQRKSVIVFATRFILSTLAASIPLATAYSLNALSLTCSSGILEILCLGASLGFLLGFRVRIIGWDMNCGKNWESVRSRKAILYHNRDTLITTQLSLVQCVWGEDKTTKGTDVIELTSPMEPAHMYPLMGMKRERNLVFNFARDVLGL